LVDVASVEMISVAVAATSVVIGVFIGVRQLRDTNKARQYQFWMEVMQYFIRERDFLSRRLGMLSWQWEDYDDFNKKYFSNHESRVTLWQVLSYYDMIGYSVKNGIVKVNQIDEEFIYNILLFWRKFSPYIVESRKRSSNVLWRLYVWQNFEWLAKECEKREQEIIQASQKRQ